MIIIIGCIIVVASVLGGFLMVGGHPGALMHVSEFLIIGGGAFGALVISSPRKVLMDMIHGLTTAMKGAPYNRQSYEELLKALYELFLLGRRNGMIALEEHVMSPETSSIFNKYPNFKKDARSMEFLCGALRPIIDGKIKPDQLSQLFDIELSKMEDDHHAPVTVLTKAADSMPGFGIVAAVLGIVVTMASISGPIEEIGHKVAAALVGTFLGILLSYGFMNPLAQNLDFTGQSEISFLRTIATCVTGFAGGMAPIMAVELGRRGLGTDLRPTADELESMLKNLNAAPKPA
ncbi:MAG: flagellar motor stator protein MotA [Verrucomicrobia bacterium]|nr:flagellar motor stator protein MotA [Verrucomicrobiota bacterium]